VRLAVLADLVVGTPLDFDYPTEGASASLFKLGKATLDSRSSSGVRR